MSSIWRQMAPLIMHDADIGLCVCTAAFDSLLCRTMRILHAYQHANIGKRSAQQHQQQLCIQRSYVYMHHVHCAVACCQHSACDNKGTHNDLWMLTKTHLRLASGAIMAGH